MANFWKVHAFSLATALGVAYILCAIFDVLFPPFGLLVLLVLLAQVSPWPIILSGFLLQWPTILTLAMFPVLTWMYLRLARRAEREVAAEFGAAYVRYADATPAFFQHRFPRRVD